jgi:hypothetical protein
VTEREFTPEEAAEELRLRLQVYRGAKDATRQLRELLEKRAYFRGNAVLRERPSDPQEKLF